MRDFILALLFSAFILFGASGCPSAQSQEYTLSWIHDGDTITVKRGDKRVKVRLYGIDAPELDQPGGQVSLHFLMGFKGQKVHLQTINKDRLGRTVAIVSTDDTTLNAALLEAGHAWVYPRFCHLPVCGEWAEFEALAKAPKKGLWQEENPVPPWAWRQGKKGFLLQF